MTVRVLNPLKKRRWLGAALAVVGVVGLPLSMARPAQADDWHHHGYYGHWHRHWAPGPGYYGYAPPVVYGAPQVVYAPPPVVYAPPSVAYAPPQLNVVLPLR